MKTKYFLTLLFATGLLFQNVTSAQDTIPTNDYEVRPFQFTFLFPPFSSNGPQNVNIVNNFSLNLFVGVSGGVDGAELGGFINVDRYFVTGLQAAGFGNTVGGNMDGLQFAGFYNANAGNVRYVQGAGFINVTGGNQFGLQGAGFGNVVGGNVTGFQGAGFMNVVGGGMTGIQGAGFMNVNGNATSGIQAAGFINVANDFRGGIQGAGFGNVARHGKVNLQGAGFFNVADSVEGLQGAGFINVAGTVKGVMAAGFINICDSIDGVPIGFINIVRKNGYRNFELGTSETQYFSLAYRMGVEKLYTIYQVGKPYGPGNRWTTGIGLGSQWPLGAKAFMNIEALSSQVFSIGNYNSTFPIFYQPYLNLLNQLRFTIGTQVGPAQLFAGPTLNVLVKDVDADPDVRPLDPRWALTYASRYGNIETSIWFGVRGGIRF